MKPTPKYKITKDPVFGDYIIQVYYGSQIGWSYVTVKPTLEAAKNWILEGIVIIES